MKIGNKELFNLVVDSVVSNEKLHKNKVILAKKIPYKKRVMYGRIFFSLAFVYYVVGLLFLSKLGSINYSSGEGSLLIFLVMSVVFAGMILIVVSSLFFPYRWDEILHGLGELSIEIEKGHPNQKLDRIYLKLKKRIKVYINIQKNKHQKETGLELYNLLINVMPLFPYCKTKKTFQKEISSSFKRLSLSKDHNDLHNSIIRFGMRLQEFREIDNTGLRSDNPEDLRDKLRNRKKYPKIKKFFLNILENLEGYPKAYSLLFGLTMFLIQQAISFYISNN